MSASFETIALLLPAAPNSRMFAAVVARLFAVADFFAEADRSRHRSQDVADFFSKLVHVGIDKERLLLAAADLSLLDAARVLIQRHGALGTEASKGDGRRARTVGINSSDVSVSRLFKTLGAFLQRYEIEKGPSVHKSKTSEVRWATDVDTGTSVALKLMRHKDHFERELHSRFDGGRNLGACCIEILGWHAPNSCAAFASTGLQREPATELSHTTASHTRASTTQDEHAYPYVLVMVRGCRSLWTAMATERIARYEPSICLSIFRQVVQQVQRLHGAGLAHCDIKPRNVLVDSSTFTVTLCDLDAAVAIGDSRGEELKCTTSYAPPEHMKALLAEQYLQAKTSFDVWSLGVVLFEMLAGRHLFPQVIYQHFNQYC